MLHIRYIIVDIFLFSKGFTAQVLEKYPFGQNFYEGGSYGIMKDMIRIVKEQKIDGRRD